MSHIKQSPMQNPWKKIEPISEAELKSAFSGSIKAVHVGIMYQLGLFFVMVAMMLLPVLYIILIALAGYGLFYHIVNMPGIISGWYFGPLGIIAYIGPIIVGGLLILFMIKPFFSPPRHPDSNIQIQHEDAPLFFALADIICELVRAPKPNAIMVNCDLNASASFRKGLFSFLSHDLTLTFGMPLIADLSVQQVAGIMAHEFGHFSQSAGMRMSYIVRKINYWFYRVVFERDNWDATLIELFESADIYFRVVWGVARIFVWITRKILWIFMMTGNLISGFFSRQMELNADRYEVRIAGRDTFNSTILRMDTLVLAARAAYFDMMYAWEEQRLVDDYPKYILAKAGQVEKDNGATEEQSGKKEKTGFFDTHYAVADRIKKVAKEDTDGILNINAPGVALFKDPESLSKQATLAHHKAVILEDISPDDLIAADRFLEQQSAIDREAKSGHRFFGETLNAFRPLHLSDLTWSGQKEELDLQQLKKELDRKKQFMEKMYEDAKATNNRWGEVRVEKLEVQQKIGLLILKETNTSLDFGSDKEKAKEKLEALRGEELKIVEKITDYESQVLSRLKIDLLLLNCPRIADRITDIEDLKNRLEPVLKVTKFLMPLGKIINRLRENYVEAENFDKLHGKLSGVRAYDEKLTDFHETLKKNYEELNKTCKEITYPYEHVKSPITLDKFLIDGEITDLGFLEIVSLTIIVINRYTDFYFRVMGTLSNVAETVESAL